ncbi:hypothetical protein FRC01_001946 [Tulasnella sp. 417]|nr:hypothetical protein FRC01_001946 [Tulasnella sp. 417]
MIQTKGFQSHDAAPPGVAGGPGHTVSVPAISQLPTELLAEILHSTLHLAKPNYGTVDIGICSYMQRLYTLRRVAKHWQEVIEGTPTFWTFVLSALPPHVNAMAILRSKNHTLSVVYAPTMFGRRLDRLTPKDFLATVAHTRPRWSAYDGPVVPEYLESPAPLLRKMCLSGTFDDESDMKPLDLLGGCTADLRQVDLSGISIDWKMGMFSHLDSLILRDLGWDGLTTTHLLDFLRSSPCLEKLRLENVHATADHGPSSHPITLHHLRSIELADCEGNIVASSLSQIRAPSCIRFYVYPNLENQLNLPRFLDEIFQPFKGILRAIHERNGRSQIAIDSSGLHWQTFAEVVDNHSFCIGISCSNSANCIRWVERILQSSLGLRIALDCGANLSEDVLETIAPMRCVTEVCLTGDWHRTEIRPIFKFLGKRVVTSPHLPSLPCLRELRINSGGWNAQDLLGMLQSRFSLFSQATAEPPLLTINMSRGAFQWNGSPRPILDYFTLNKIREAKGLKRIRFVGKKDRDGMLAIVWAEEISKPLWSLASYAP